MMFEGDLKAGSMAEDSGSHPSWIVNGDPRSYGVGGRVVRDMAGHRGRRQHSADRNGGQKKEAAATYCSCDGT